jgi:glutathione S-transferase
VEKGLMRIYNMRFCPYAQRSLLVGTAKNVKYVCITLILFANHRQKCCYSRFEIVNVNLTEKPDWFLALNPRGQVPTLELDDGRILAESLIVADYLDEVGDKSKMLHPKDSFQKAKDRLLVERFNLVRLVFFFL